MTVFIVLWLCVLLWWGTRFMNRLYRERQAAEEARRQSEELLRSFFDNSTSMVWIKDPEGRFLNVNRYAERIFDRKLAQLRGRTADETLPQIQSAILAEHDRQALAAGKPMEFEESLSTPTGPRTFAATKFPLHDAQGRLRGLAAICTDITERKQAERMLRAGEERLRLFIGYAPAAIAMFDTSMRYLAVSQRWKDDFALRGRQILGLSHYEVFPEIPEHLREAHRRALAGEVLRAEEERFERADGSVQWLRWEMRPWRDAAGTVGGIVIFSEDIGSIKRAESAVEQSDARYRALVEQSADALFVHDFAGRFVEVSQRASQSVGYTKDELLAMNVVDLEQDFDLVRAQEAWRKLEPGSATTLLGHQRRKDGHVFPVEVRFCVLAFEGRRLYAGAVRDITEREQAEAAIRRGDERLHLALEAAQAGVWEWDVATDRNFWSPEVYGLYGMDARSTEPSYEAWLAAVRPEDRAAVAQAVRTATEQRAEVNIEWRVHRTGAEQDGADRWLASRGKPECDAAGRLLRYRGVVADITARKRGELALRESESRLQMALSGADMATWDLDARTGITHYSERWASMQGYRPEELPAQLEQLEQRVHPDDRAALHQKMVAFLRGEAAGFTSEHRVRHKDGRWVWVQARGSVIDRDEKGQPRHAAGVVVDVSERKEAEAQLRKLSQAVEQSPESIIITNLAGQIEYVNEAFCRSSGYRSSEVLGKRPDVLDADSSPSQSASALSEAMKKGEAWQGELRNRRKDGSEYAEFAIVAPIREADGRITHYVSVQQDVTERVQAARRIEHLAFYDQLTGLPNRTLLFDRLKQAAANCSRLGVHGVLMMIDLDHFKMLNDTLGHDIGDLLLKQAAGRIGGCVRRADTLARLGGDEFMLVMAGLSANVQEAAAFAESVGRKILGVFTHDFQLGGVAHHCSASIGIALFDSDAVAGDELLKQADLAMYKAKESGRDTLRFFDPQMEAAVKRRSAMEKDLRRALEEHQFELHYQPQVQGEGRIIGLEALVRWRHPERGLVSPGDFIPIAEETGLILPLGREIFAMAFAQMARWSKQPALAGLMVAVNMSARQIRQPDFVEQLLTALRSAGASAGRLKLELTESLLIENIEDIIEKMVALKSQGVGFALDDFGTGFSSLTYLKRLPLDELKIDQSFVRDVLTDPNDAAIARTIVALAASLGLGVIAEGVETEAQRVFLADAGCKAYQGYLFSRPVEAAAIESLVDHTRGLHTQV
jgi:diguanylate cyclase (GGDEF)-like protein/PAS domain S-box-containing protein